MLTQFRHIQKGTLIVVTVLIVIAFAFLYSDFDFVQGTVGRQDCVVKVYDRCYRQKEAQKLAANFDVSLQLGMYEFATVLFGENRRDQDRTDFVMSLVILRKEADRLGVEPTAAEIKEAIPNLPIFQQPGVTAAYIQNNILGPNGFTDGDLAELVGDYLSYRKLRSLIGAGIEPIPSETERRYLRANQRYTASVVRFDREDYVDSVEVSDEEIQEYYEENADQLASDPKRGFDYVKFTPKEVAEDATNEERAKAGLAFANAVNRAYADLADEDADFASVAEQYQGSQADFDLESGALEPFSPTDPPELLEDDDGEIMQTLFSEALQQDDVTVPFRADDGGYLVFHFSGAVEPKPLEPEEAKPAIEEALMARKSNRAVNDAANAAVSALNEALAAGESFAAAAEQAGVETVELPNFSQAEPPAEVDDASLILDAVDGLGEKELSSVIERPGGDGYLIVYVDSIEIYEEEEEESEKRSLAASAEGNLERTMFTAWFNQQRAKSTSERPFSGQPIE